MSYVSDPIRFAISVTPNDDNDIGPFRAIYVATSGDVEVMMAGDRSVVLFEGLPVGWHPIQGVRIMLNTSASSIIAGW